MEHRTIDIVRSNTDFTICRFVKMASPSMTRNGDSGDDGIVTDIVSGGSNDRRTSSSESIIDAVTVGAAAKSGDNSVGIGAHVVVFLEKVASSAFPFNFRSTYPLLFVHATTGLRLASRIDQDIDIVGAQKYYNVGKSTIWEIPITGERLFDFKNTRVHPTNFESYIVHLIIKNRIIYIVNLPINYHQLFENVWRRWANKVGDYARMRESV